jgi:transcriptional regulator with XRE-family HTH domain
LRLSLRMELKLARQIKGLSQQQLADRAGCNIATISRLETERSDYLAAEYGLIVRIAREIGLEPLVLFPVDTPAATTGARKKSA